LVSKLIADDKTQAITEANGQSPKPGGISWPKIARRIRVPLSFVFAIAYVWVAAPTVLSLAVGMPIAAVGLALRAAAAGHVRKDRELTTSGPYAYTRNPLYLGSLLIGVGFAIAARNAWIIVALLALLFAIYWPLILAEERYLRSNFSGYDEYASRVPRMFPRVRGLRGEVSGNNNQFSRDLYLRHREYRAVFGAIVVCAILIAKMLLLRGPHWLWVAPGK
jgi:protein-S-isoprenylcysteine O-methyltransferase Ste14